MKVSIPITCFNCRGFLKDAVKSIVNQTYTNWEIVFVNDASTDESLNYIRKLIKKFNIGDKVKIITNEENKGYGFSLRKGIENSTGELVAVVDSDDALARQDALGIMVKVHTKHPKASLVYSNHWECTPDLRAVRQTKSRQLRDGETFLDHRAKVSHLKCFKRSYYDKTEGINPVLKQTVDKDLVLKLEEVGKLIYIDKALYLYRKHNRNLTRSLRKKPKEYRKHVGFWRKQVFEEARKRRGIKK